MMVNLWWCQLISRNSVQNDNKTRTIRVAVRIGKRRRIIYLYKIWLLIRTIWIHLVPIQCFFFAERLQLDVIFSMFFKAIGLDPIDETTMITCPGISKNVLGFDTSPFAENIDWCSIHDLQYIWLIMVNLELILIDAVLLNYWSMRLVPVSIHQTYSSWLRQ